MQASVSSPFVLLSLTFFYSNFTQGALFTFPQDHMVKNTFKQHQEQQHSQTYIEGSNSKGVLLCRSIVMIISKSATRETQLQLFPIVIPCQKPAEGEHRPRRETLTSELINLQTIIKFSSGRLTGIESFSMQRST